MRVTWLRDRLPSTVIFAASLLLSAYGGIVLLLGHGGIFIAAVIAWACAQTLLIVLCVLHFLSASRRNVAEQRVQQLAQMQRSILDSAGPMILATDLDGNLQIFNPAAERMLGYRVNEVLGRLRAQELFPPGELDRIGQVLVSRSRACAGRGVERSLERASALCALCHQLSRQPGSRIRNSVPPQGRQRLSRHGLSLRGA